MIPTPHFCRHWRRVLPKNAAMQTGCLWQPETGRGMTRRARAGLAGRRGFSLVELLIVGVIMFGLLGGMAYVIIQTGTSVWGRTDTRLASLETVQRAMGRVRQDLNQARQATLTCSAVAEQLDFDPIPTIGGPHVTYRRNAQTNQLIRTPQGQVGQVVAGGVTRFTPLGCAAGLVTLEITARVVTADQAVSTQTLKSQLMVRNP